MNISTLVLTLIVPVILILSLGVACGTGGRNGTDSADSGQFSTTSLHIAASVGSAERELKNLRGRLFGASHFARKEDVEKIVNRKALELGRLAIL